MKPGAHAKKAISLGRKEQPDENGVIEEIVTPGAARELGIANDESGDEDEDEDDEDEDELPVCMVPVLGKPGQSPGFLVRKCDEKRRELRH